MRFFSLLLSLHPVKFSPKSCQECIYFEPRDHPFTTSLSKCRRFGERDHETGRISYEYADLCRKSEFKCGDGKHFEQK